MRAALLCFLSCLAATPAFADRYMFDKAHTYIHFYVNHLGFSDLLGRCTQYDGYIDFDEQDPAASRINISLSAADIRTSSELLDLKLQGEEYFDSDRFPNIRFVSTAVQVTGSNTADVTGNLTLRGITRPVRLRVRLNKAAYNPVTRLYTAGFAATATVKRSDFGMTVLLPDVSDEVRLDISAETVNETRKKAESLNPQ